jgi:hypothetical protein
VLGVVPAAVAFVLLVDRRAITRRVVAAGIVLTAMAVAQYGFILLRTRQGAAYLESRAWSLTELYRVVTAERYADSRFAFTWHDLLFVQLPRAVTAITQDLGWAASALFVLGVAVAVRKRSANALLVAAAAAGLLAFIVNLDGDIGGFVTPLLVLVWPLSAFGLQVVHDALNARMSFGIDWRHSSANQTLRVGTGSLAVIALLAMVMVRGVSSYAVADQSGNTGEAAYYRTLYGALPARAAVVAENYTVDMAVQYLMFTGEAGPAKDVMRLAFSGREVRAAIADGRRVFALRTGATFLASEGLRFEPTTMGTPLDVWLARLPPGSLVVGSSASAAFPLEAFGRLRLSAPSPGRGHPYTAFAFVVGQSELAWKVEDRPIALLIDEGLVKVPMPPLSDRLAVSADEDGAGISIGDRQIAHAQAGTALAAFDPTGRLLTVLRLGPGDPLTVPLDPPVFEYRDTVPCVALEPGVWTDISEVSTVSGSWVTTLTNVGTVRLEIEVERDGVTTTELIGGGNVRVAESVATDAPSTRVTTELTRTHFRRALFRTVLDAGPSRARVKLELPAQSLHLCAHVPTPPRAAAGRLLIPIDSEANFGRGWSRPETSRAGIVRRASVAATIVLPLAPAHAYRLWLNGAAAPGLWFTIDVDGATTGECEFRPNAPCSIDIPGAPLRPDISNLTIRLSRPSSHESAVALTLYDLELEQR